MTLRPRREPLRRWLLAATLAFFCVLPSCAIKAQRIADSSFAALVARASESGGFFDSDNIISNEGSYLQVRSQLTKQGVRGGVYVGVGPDQNFSYIAFIRPAIAFMVDIR